MQTPWLPHTHKMPQGFDTDRLRLRRFTIHDAVKDYDAVTRLPRQAPHLYAFGSDTRT